MTPARHTLRAWAAAFSGGARQTLTAKANLASGVFIYIVLLMIFRPIYQAMPLEPLGMPGLTPALLLWYFAVVECLVCGFFFSRFGALIAGGRLTEMMQRPLGLRGLFLCGAMGAHATQALVLLIVALCVVPLMTGVGFPVALSHLPLFLVVFVLALLILNLLGYITGMVEIFGPYSTPLGWIVGKMIFSLGGLFFPVVFFPPAVKMAVALTPFPAILGAPGGFVLGLPGWPALATQAAWVAVLFGVAAFAERRLINRVLDRGD